MNLRDFVGPQETDPLEMTGSRLASASSPATRAMLPKKTVESSAPICFLPEASEVGPDETVARIDVLHAIDAQAFYPNYGWQCQQSPFQKVCWQTPIPPSVPPARSA